MDNGDQVRALVEIRDTLRQMAETQKIESAKAAEYRESLSKAQEAAQSFHRQVVSRQKNENRLWFAPLAALVVIAGLSMSQQIDTLFRKAARMANIPEFRP